MRLPHFYPNAYKLPAILALLAGTYAYAQTDAAQTLERQSDAAFQQVLQNPENLSLWSTYAQLLIRQGNYEGGVAALERLLLEPNAPPELRVDIGILYYRMASYAQAEALLRTALEDKRLQGDKRALAQTLADDCAKRQQTSLLSGAFYFGLRHQSNAMYRTDSTQVIVGGVSVPYAKRPESNTDASIGLRLRHLYDLERQNSAAIQTNFGVYALNYSSSAGSTIVADPTKPANLLVLDLSTGLQFKPSPADLQELTVRPHIIGLNVLAQGKQYVSNAGLGLDASWQFSEFTLLDLTLDTQNRRFANRIDNPSANLISGQSLGLRARLIHELAPGQRISGDFATRSNRAKRDFYDSNTNELRITYAISYASPLAGGGNWTTSVYAGASRRSYGAPDPAVSVAASRKDNESRIGITHSMPITPAWSVLFTLEQARNRANFANFNYKNTSLSGTVIRSF